MAEQTAVTAMTAASEPIISAGNEALRAAEQVSEGAAAVGRAYLAKAQVEAANGDVSDARQNREKAESLQAAIAAKANATTERINSHLEAVETKLRLEERQRLAAVHVAAAHNSSNPDVEHV